MTAQPPPQMPPPLPKTPDALKPAGLAAQDQKQHHRPQQAAQPSAPKRSSLAWLWVLLLLIGGVGYWVWHYQVAQQAMYGFQPPEMAIARYTPEDVIGDLGGLKVRIPRHYAEYVEYDGDPGFGKERQGPVPERTFDSRLRGFGISVRFPDMKGLENEELEKEFCDNSLNPNNPWVSMVIISGEYYPGLGMNSLNAQTEHLWKENDFWLYNYELFREDIYGLEMYVVRGLDPKTGQLARESSNTKDFYVQRDKGGHVYTYIECGRPAVPEGVGSCSLKFILEPKAKVKVGVRFSPALLPYWREIRQSAGDLLLSFGVKEADVSNGVESR